MSIPSSEAPVSEAQARQSLQDLKLKLKKEAELTRRHFAAMVTWAQERLAYARQERQSFEGLAAKLKPHTRDARAAFDHDAVSLLAMYHLAVEKQTALELSAYEHNLALLKGYVIEPEGLEAPEFPEFRDPTADPDYPHWQALADLALVEYFWEQYLPGIDAILRVTGGETAIHVDSPAREAECAQRADALQAAMQGDRNLAVLIQQAGTTLKDVPQLLQWGANTLVELRAMPDVARKPHYQDPRWAKLAGKADYLGGLAARAEAFGHLASLIPHHPQQPLPYNPPTLPGTNALR